MADTSRLTRAAANLLDVVAPGIGVRDLYSDEGSEVYDAMSLGDDSEIREVLRIARRARGSILELAAGSGRLTLPMARLGRPVVALDASQRMLKMLEARAKAMTEPVWVQTVHADMAQFDLDEEFGLIVLATTSITLLDRAQRASMLDAARRHLAPDGMLVLSVHATLPHPTGATVSVVPLPNRAGNRVGDAVALLSEQVDAGGAHRDVTVIQLRRDGDEPCSAAFTSRVHLLDRDRLVTEVRMAGFTVTETLAVRGLTGPHALSMLVCAP